jgi:hypothetical protein
VGAHPEQIGSRMFYMPSPEREPRRWRYINYGLYLGLLLAAVVVVVRLEDSGTVHVDFMDAAAVLDLVDNRAGCSLHSYEKLLLSKPEELSHEETI